MFDEVGWQPKLAEHNLYRKLDLQKTKIEIAQLILYTRR